MFDEIARDQLVDVHRRAGSLGDRVRAIRVDHEVERLSKLHEPVHETLGSLIVHVVVTRTMHDQEMPA